MVLRDLPRDLMGSIHQADGDSGSPQNWQKDIGVVGASSPETSIAELSAVPGTRDDPAGPDSPPAPAPLSAAPSDAPSALPTPPHQPPASPLRESGREGASAEEEAFIEFCLAASPLGDMRMLVVAAEGARRFLSMDGVDAPSLERLFDLVGWRSPHSLYSDAAQRRPQQIPLVGTAARPVPAATPSPIWGGPPLCPNSWLIPATSIGGRRPNSHPSACPGLLMFS